MNNPILIIILIFAVAVLAIIFIIIKSANNTINNFKNNNIYLKEEKEDFILIKLVKLDVHCNFYKKPYLYLGTFKYLYKEKQIDLYIEEYDAQELMEKEEYQVLHEGTVVYEIKKKIL